MRENKATVKDEGLGAAFTEGFNEGMRLIGYSMVFFSVAGESIKTFPAVPNAQVAQLVAEHLATLRDESLAKGVVIRILPASKGDPAPPQEPVAAVGDGVEDAEIVE
jgi:hypothetical protein